MKDINGQSCALTCVKVKTVTIILIRGSSMFCIQIGNFKNKELNMYDNTLCIAIILQGFQQGPHF